MKQRFIIAKKLKFSKDLLFSTTSCSVGNRVRANTGDITRNFFESHAVVRMLRYSVCISRALLAQIECFFTNEVGPLLLRSSSRTFSWLRTIKETQKHDSGNKATQNDYSQILPNKRPSCIKVGPFAGLGPQIGVHMLDTAKYKLIKPMKSAPKHHTHHNDDEKQHKKNYYLLLEHLQFYS